ncbi:hypothetical protein [Halosegnis longus]|uniref:hypothetical protein n=1 Tax=Halosegnis longus TaxID=2216012 RepID=UPI00129EDE4A|nr:hypothetical protein [Halosegnis longus]
MVAPGLDCVRPADARPADHVWECRPRLSEWLPSMLEDSLDTLAGIVDAELTKYDLGASQSGRIPAQFLDQLREAGITAQGGIYADRLARYATRFGPTASADGPPQYEQQLRRQLTQLGTPGGVRFESDWRETLATGPVAVFAQASYTPTVRVEFAGDWTDVRRETAARSLAALSTVAEACRVEVIVASTATRQWLQARHSEWLATHECRELPGSDLTAGRDGSPEGGHDEAAITTAREWATQATGDTGPAQLVAALAEAPDHRLSLPSLAEAPTVTVADASLYVYARRLADAGLVEYHRHTSPATPSELSLTPAGVAASEYVSPGGETVRDPAQQQLASQCTDTHNGSPSTVGLRRSGAGVVDGPASEAALARTGDPDKTGEWTRWLGGETPETAAEPLHRRTTAPLTGETDIAVVDSPVTDWHQATKGDSRVGYVSQAVGDELLVMVQYALDPLATLGRIAASVCSPRVMARCLDATHVGSDFGELFESFDAPLDERTLDVSARQMLVNGLQVGWTGEEPTAREGTLDRWQTLRAQLLADVGRLTGPHGQRGDPAERAACFRRLHGLITSMTSLLYAAGYEPIINVRVPQAAQIRDDQYYRRDFLAFWQHTIPKHAVYASETGWHSWLRQVADPDAFDWGIEKLRRRLPPAIESNTTAELTTNWVISGPDMSELQAPIGRAIRREHRRLRTDGDGEPVEPPLELTLTDAATPARLARQLAAGARARGYTIETPDGKNGAATPSKRCRRLLDRCRRVCAPADGRLDPHLLADIVTRLPESHGEERLTRRAIDQALARLPASRVCPELPDSAGRILQSLLIEQEAGRQDILARLDMHPNTWNRQVAALRDRGVVQSAASGGYQTYEPRLAVETDGVSEPETASPPSLDSFRDTRQETVQTAVTAAPARGRPPPTRNPATICVRVG